jgi:triosephosphate isomerase (TIM)
MRKKFIAGNWKMYTNSKTALELAAAVDRGFKDEDRITVAICPPFPFLKLVCDYLKLAADPATGPTIAVGAQNCYHEKEGAFTGEVSPTMLVDVGCRYVILGHSERRHKLGETDAFINRKVHAALAAGLTAIVCVGETIQDREANRTEAVLDTQLTGSLANVSPDMLANVVLAYEPVWAIGTGKIATPEQAQEAHAFLRGRIGQLFGADAAAKLVIQYGGSAKPENVRPLLHQPDVDGALVGGASLKADDFLTIIRWGIP